MTRLLIAIAAVLLLATVATAQTQSEDDLALLDSALEQPALTVRLTVRLLIGDPTVPFDDNLDQPDVWLKVGAASTEAVAVMDAIGSKPCYEEWFEITRTAYWLVARSADLQAERAIAVDEKLNDMRDRIDEELGHSLAGFHLVEYGAMLRERVDCAPVMPTARPATPTPARSIDPGVDSTQPTARPESPTPSEEN